MIHENLAGHKEMQLHQSLYAALRIVTYGDVEEEVMKG
jgi:hypothetical protein